MNNDVDSLIIEYADALKHAAEGAWGTWPIVLDHAVNRCTPQMARFNNAEHAILALSGRSDLPEPVVAFIAASADSGCPLCWVSSNKEPNHPECSDKIERFFDARDALKRYGESLIHKVSGAFGSGDSASFGWRTS
jgi:hypothetical protein